MSERTRVTADRRIGGPRVDRMPRRTLAERRAFAQLPVEERIAAYLRSLRRMAMFFTALTVVSLVVGLVLGLAVH